ncbi:hypothetical protein E2320_012136 [Naja naja]|nr:hypothetical protein E2320_012136 [Naja naja]
MLAIPLVYKFCTLFDVCKGTWKSVKPKHREEQSIRWLWGSPYGRTLIFAFSQLVNKREFQQGIEESNVATLTA